MSILLSIWAFSWNCIISFFQNFGMVLEIHTKLCRTEPDFPGKIFSPKNGEIKQKWSKELLKHLVIFIDFYWIFFVMKICFICCVSAQIPCLGKFLFVRFGPKFSQPIRLQDSLINHICRTNQCWYKFM